MQVALLTRSIQFRGILHYNNARRALLTNEELEALIAELSADVNALTNRVEALEKADGNDSSNSSDSSDDNNSSDSGDSSDSSDDNTSSDSSDDNTSSDSGNGDDDATAIIIDDDFLSADDGDTYGNGRDPDIGKPLDLLHGCHVIVRGAAEAAFNHVMFYRCGQKGLLGRYPLHFHKPSQDGDFSAIGCSFLDNFNRAVTLHDTRGVRFNDNVVLTTRGHSVFLEDGPEQDNELVRNLVVDAIEISEENMRLVPSDVSCTVAQVFAFLFEVASTI